MCTLSTGATIIRQRRNAAAAQTKGVEANVRQTWRDFRGEIRLSLRAIPLRDRAFGVPQVPRHQGSAMVSFHRRGTLASVGVRSYARQFEDDLDIFTLPGYATLQVTARQQIKKGFSAVVSFENLLNRRYLVGFSPTPTIGAPRLWRAGLKWEGRL